MGLDSLGVRWLIAVAVYCVTFVVLMDVVLFGADLSMIVQGGIMFALIVSTICVLLMWRKNTRSLPYSDVMFASGIAALLLIGALPSDGRFGDVWSLSSALLLVLGILVGIVGRWVYATLTGLLRGWIRRRSHAA